MRFLLSLAVGTIGTVPVAFAVDEKPSTLPADPVKIAWPAAATARQVRIPALDSSGDAARLVKPFGVAVDRTGRIFVADPAHRAIVVYPRAEGPAARWKGNPHFPLVGPVAVAADSGGRVFAVDGYQAHVVVFDATGAPIAVFGKGILLRPEGIAIDSAAGRIYVGDVKAHQSLSLISTA